MARQSNKAWQPDMTWRTDFNCRPYTPWQSETVNNRSTMATSKVFGIPELVEMILEELPFNDVLRMLRLTKTVQESIKSSPKLRRTLFLQQQPSNAVDQIIAPRINPFLKACLDDLTKKGVYHVERVLSPEERRQSKWRFYWPERLNKYHDASYEEGLPFFIWIRMGNGKVSYLEAFVKENRANKKLWHEMYVSDRPCEIIASFDKWDGEYRFPPDIRVEEFIRRLIKRQRYRFRFGRAIFFKG